MNTTIINLEQFAITTSLFKYISRTISSEIYAATGQMAFESNINTDEITKAVLAQIAEYFDFSNITLQEKETNQ